MVRLIQTIAALLLATGTAAAADLTPRDVWDDWVASFDDADITTESVQDTGRNLSITGLSVISGTEETGRTEILIDEVRMERLPDGSVRVTTSPEYPITMSGSDENGVTRVTRLLASHPGLEMIVSDQGDALQHSFSAPEIRVDVVEVIEDSVVSDLTGNVSLTEVTGRYLVGEEAIGDSAMQVAQLTANLSETEPENGGEFIISLSANEFASSNLLDLLGPALSGADTETEDSSMQASYTAGDSRVSISIKGNPGETFDAQIDASGLSNEIDVTPSRMSYRTATGTTNLTAEGSQLPFPVEVNLGETMLDMSTPLQGDDEPQPFTARFSMAGLTVNDAIWNMFDPAAILPRDPGDLILDLSGEMMMAEDISTDSVPDQNNAKIERLSVNELRAAVLGAEVLANGELTFPNVSISEPPAGSVDVIVRGVSVLINRLSETGILSMDQAMSAGLMLHMLTGPGETEDERESHIRFIEDGSVFINDQQLR